MPKKTDDWHDAWLYGLALVTGTFVLIFICYEFVLYIIKAVLASAVP